MSLLIVSYPPALLLAGIFQMPGLLRRTPVFIAAPLVYTLILIIPHLSTSVEFFIFSPFSNLILRFEKHKGNPARPLEAYHERQKEQYASNLDIDKRCTLIALGECRELFDWMASNIQMSWL